MPTFSVLYYPTWNPPTTWLRSTMLFFDKVEFIVPTDVQAKYKRANAELFDMLPDAVGQVRAKSYELQLSRDAMARLERAFDEIAEHQPVSHERTFNVVIGRGGELEVQGHTWLHESKTSIVIYNLLKDRQLVQERRADEIGGPEGFRAVNTKAANLILSLIADEYAGRKGVRTITDEELDYSVVSLNAIGLSQSVPAVSQLACAVIRSTIPTTISSMAVTEYVELRNRFENVRIPFQQAVRQLCDDSLLSDIRDLDEFKERLQSAAREFRDGVEAMRRQPWFSRVKDWMPFGIGTLSAFAGLADEAWLIGSGAVASVGLHFFDQVRRKPVESSATQAQRLVAGMSDRLLQPRLVRRLVTHSAGDG